MIDIKIQIISDDQLTKHQYCFELQGNKLIYKSWFEYNRSNRKEKWADEKPKPLSIGDWCKKYKKDIENYDDNYFGGNEYNEYLNKLNPVLQKTRQGKTKLYGKSGCTKFLPKCPKNVAILAKSELIRKITNELEVVYD